MTRYTGARGWVAFYFLSVTIIVGATAGLKVVTVAFSHPIPQRDILFNVGTPTVMLSAAFIELLVILFLRLSKDTLLKAWVVLWVSGLFTSYRCLVAVLAPSHSCPCFGFLSLITTESRTVADCVGWLFIAYFVIGSASVIVAPLHTHRQ